MKANIQAFRALTAVIFQRLFTPLVWIVGGAIVILYSLTIYLGGWVHPLWWLLLVVLTPLTLIFTALGAAVWYLSTRLIPRPLSKTERARIDQAADKVIRVAEVRATPVPLLLVLIARDIIRGKNSSYIESVVNDTTSLKHDFFAARELFDPKKHS